MNGSDDERAQLRRTLRRARETVPPERARDAAREAAEYLLALPELASVGTVALYAPVHGELDPGPVARDLAARGVALLYPRVDRDARRLTFHRVDDLAALARGNFGIPEPSADAPVVPVHAVDLFLVPGLAFDQTGTRLGWGRGYYDRTLAADPSRLRIGYCYRSQVLDRVPRHPHDLPMHILVTEAGVTAAHRPDAPTF